MKWAWRPAFYCDRNGIRDRADDWRRAEADHSTARAVLHFEGVSKTAGGAERREYKPLVNSDGRFAKRDGYQRWPTLWLWASKRRVGVTLMVSDLPHWTASDRDALAATDMKQMKRWCGSLTYYILLTTGPNMSILN